MRSFRVAAALSLVGAVISVAAPADAGSDVQLSTQEGPVGTVVAISRANGGTAEHPCTEPITVKATPVGEEQGADLSGGEPFTPPAGTWTVPFLAPGGYSVNVVCGGVQALDYFFFTVTPSAIVAGPRLAG
jgi:hypothetical protein